MLVKKMNQSLRRLHDKGPSKIVKTRMLTGMTRGIERLQEKGQDQLVLTMKVSERWPRTRRAFEHHGGMSQGKKTERDF